MQYVNELKKLESELTNEQNPVPEVPEVSFLKNDELQEGEESMNLDTIIENYKDLDSMCFLLFSLRFSYRYGSY